MEPELIKLLETIKQTRKSILDLMDAAYSSTPQWRMIRSRILSALGRNGLEGEIGQLLRMERQGAGDDRAERN